MAAFPAHWRPMAQPTSMGIHCYLAGVMAADLAQLMRRALLAGQTKRQQMWAQRQLSALRPAPELAPTRADYGPSIRAMEPI